jgi:Fe-S-cluster containining protein
MNNSISSFNEPLEVLENLGFSQTCPDCDGSCCKMPWVTKEERLSELDFQASLVEIKGTHFIERSDRCVFLNETGKCSIYQVRPLDCRLFPLDIIEIDGIYH